MLREINNCKELDPINRHAIITGSALRNAYRTAHMIFRYYVTKKHAAVFLSVRAGQWALRNHFINRHSCYQPGMLSRSRHILPEAGAGADQMFTAQIPAIKYQPFQNFFSVASCMCIHIQFTLI